jgi:hypothetical protein
MRPCPGCGEEVTDYDCLIDHDRAWHLECWNFFVETLDSASPVA